jgi:hypothetical protein
MIYGIGDNLAPALRDASPAGSVDFLNGKRGIAPAATGLLPRA